MKNILLIIIGAILGVVLTFLYQVFGREVEPTEPSGWMGKAECDALVERLEERIPPELANTQPIKVEHAPGYCPCCHEYTLLPNRDYNNHDLTK